MDEPSGALNLHGSPGLDSCPSGKLGRLSGFGWSALAPSLSGEAVDPPGATEEPPLGAPDDPPLGASDDPPLAVEPPLDPAEDPPLGALDDPPLGAAVEPPFESAEAPPLEASDPSLDGWVGWVG